MFGRQSIEKAAGEHEGNERLSGLLCQWKGMEPGARFETDVWRRIRTTLVHEQRGLFPIGLLRDWMLPQPVWAGALAAIVAIMVGVLTGIPTPAIHAKRFSDAPLLDRQTLAGSYLRLVTGQTR